MKLEEYIESIFGCLERIENKINGLSAPLLEGNSPTVNNEKETDESVLNEVSLLFLFPPFHQSILKIAFPLNSKV